MPASYPILRFGLSYHLKTAKTQEADAVSTPVAKTVEAAMSARPPPGENDNARQALIEEKPSQAELAGKADPNRAETPIAMTFE